MNGLLDKGHGTVISIIEEAIKFYMQVKVFSGAMNPLICQGRESEETPDRD